MRDSGESTLPFSRIRQECRQPTTTITVYDGTEICFRPLRADDGDRLGRYLGTLSSETRAKWRPHDLTTETAHSLCASLESDVALRLVATTDVEGEGEVVAYFILFCDISEADQTRFQNYGLEISPKTTCQFAPSVADGYQNCGLGSRLMPHSVALATHLDYRQMILLGGVYMSNRQAVRFYRKHGFRVAGTFDPGQNKERRYDMIHSLMEGIE